MKESTIKLSERMCAEFNWKPVEWAIMYLRHNKDARNMWRKLALQKINEEEK